MNKRNYAAVFLVMLTFFVISFMTNIIGPLTPDIINGFNLSLFLVALLPFAFFIAYGLVSLPTGILVEKYHPKIIMVVAFLLSLSGSLLLSLFPNYLSAIISLFLIGSGMAMLQVIINPLLRVAGGEEHYAFNSVLAQLIFGAASFVSPLVYSYLVQNVNNSDSLASKIFSLTPAELPWISIYFLFVIISIAMILVTISFRFPKVELKADEKTGSLKAYLQMIKQPLVIAFFFGIFCYVGTEQVIANWMSQYLSVYFGYDPQTTGARAVAYFWGLMTAGGVLGLLLVKIMDSRKVLVLFTFLAILSLTAALVFSGQVALIALPLTGFFASVMYPVIISLALNSVTQNHGVFAGILLTGITGGAILPLITGWIGDNWGLKAGYCFLYLTLGYILSIGFWAKPLIANKTVSLFKKKS
ncbi:MAG: MFS transporter [Chitinophagaceae bacterium]|nr:MFS transporter [Chitinophagaceae bacterium]MCW5925872.1 MFS transporter [Chitinophagaceae bacterium]